MSAADPPIARADGAAPASTAETGLRPLYAQVRDILVRRITEGAWAPGACLPSEFALAAELNVSQGTVRKALDTLAQDRVVERRQGRGTFVVEQTPELSAYHFFRLIGPDGARLAPEPVSESIRQRTARAAEARALRIPQTARVHVISRVRAVLGTPTLVETLVLPVALAPDLPRHKPLPNAIYAFYQSVYGITVARASDRLRAVAATEAEAEILGCAPGAPLLEAERIAVDINGAPVERRVSRFPCDRAAYAAELR